MGPVLGTFAMASPMRRPPEWTDALPDLGPDASGYIALPLSAVLPGWNLIISLVPVFLHDYAMFLWWVDQYIAHDLFTYAGSNG